MKGYGRNGIMAYQHRMNGCVEFISNAHYITYDYKIKDTDRWMENQSEWKNTLNYVETRKNKIERF